MRSAKNSVCSLWRTNNRLRGTHWVLSSDLGEGQKTHWVWCLRPHSPKPCLACFRFSPVLVFFVIDVLCSLVFSSSSSLLQSWLETERNSRQEEHKAHNSNNRNPRNKNKQKQRKQRQHQQKQLDLEDKQDKMFLLVFQCLPLFCLSLLTLPFISFSLSLSLSLSLPPLLFFYCSFFPSLGFYLPCFFAFLAWKTSLNYYMSSFFEHPFLFCLFSWVVF